MKKRLITIILAGFLTLPLLTIAQINGPVDPSGNPEGGTPVGGGAPIGNGIEILLALGAAYGGRKVFYILKDS